MSFVKKLRRVRLGLQTILGWSRQGYFIPYRYAESDLRAGARPLYQAVADLCQSQEDRFQAHLENLNQFKEAFEAFDGARPPSPRWQQDWFPRLDGAMAYNMVRNIRPGTILEVGSGHSTRFMARAVADGGLETQIIAIDPAPRADISQLDRIDIHQMPVQQADWSLFDRLQSGDILFVDSSHILMPGTDVDILFNHILPKLPSGIWIHIHDITLPDDYPLAWDWRGYNEQQAVVPMLMGGGYRLEWSSHYVASRMGEAVKASLAGKLPLNQNVFETSLWLVKE